MWLHSHQGGGTLHYKGCIALRKDHCYGLLIVFRAHSVLSVQMQFTNQGPLFKIQQYFLLTQLTFQFYLFLGKMNW